MDKVCLRGFVFVILSQGFRLEMGYVHLTDSRL